jgi:soluble cytochrome b562
MKTRLFLLAAAACLLLPVRADDTPLGKQMDAFNDAYKAMRKETDPAKGAALAREAQEAILKSFTELPAMLAKMPDGPDKAKAAAEYRKMISRVLVAVCEMEQAFLAGNTSEVQKLVAGLKDMKKAGHDKFMEDE